jgi:hypothetical protein
MFEFGMVSGLLIIFMIIKFMIWIIKVDYKNDQQEKEWDWIDD